MDKEPTQVLYQTRPNKKFQKFSFGGKKAPSIALSSIHSTPVTPAKLEPWGYLWERLCNSGYWLIRTGQLTWGAAVQQHWAADINIEEFTLAKVSFISSLQTLPHFPLFAKTFIWLGLGES